eukprot:gene4405-14530_t
MKLHRHLGLESGLSFKDESEWRRSACGDANLKTGRYKNCGKASDSIPPHPGAFFRESAKEVLQRHESGELSLACLIGGQQPGSVHVHNEGLGQCNISIAASRPDTGHSDSNMHTHGTVALACVHTMPLCGGFVDMYTSEQFSYYIILLRDLLNSCESIAHLVRYMTISHRRDFIESALQLIVEKKKPALAVRLAHRYDAIVAMLGKADKKVSDVVRTAHSFGVDDLDAASASFCSSATGTTVNQHRQGMDDAKYVELLLKLEQLEDLTTRANELAVVDMSSAVGLVAASTVSQRAKIADALTKFEFNNDISPDMRWKRGSDNFERGRAILIAKNVCDLQCKVGKLVVEVRQGRVTTRRYGVSTATSKRFYKSDFRFAYSADHSSTRFNASSVSPGL